MSVEEEALRELKDVFGEKILEHKIQKMRVYVKVPSEAYGEVIKYLALLKGIYHLETITGTEVKDGIEVMAHLGTGLSISVRTTISKENPKIASICDIIPGAEFYEREIHDLLGVVFEAHPNPQRFILPGDWPEHVYPLRKSFESKHNVPLREGFD
ncbi:MAG: NADH-quinone oxidoreductase subunit C [Nitrososphaeria archaeon]